MTDGHHSGDQITQGRAATGGPRAANEPGREAPMLAITGVLSTSLKLETALERVSGLVEVLREVPRPLTDEDLDLLQDVADELAITVENTRLVERFEWEVRERELLLQVGRKVGSSLDLGEVLDHLFALLEELLPSDAGGVYLLGESDGGLMEVERRAYAPGKEDLLRDRPGKGIIGWAVEHRRGIVVGDIRDDPRYVETRPTTRSEIAAPIIHAAEVIGVITLESDTPGAYGERHLSLLELVAAQVSSAIVNAHVHQRDLRHARVSRELEAAREIQCGLLPRQRLRIGAVEVDGVNIPSSTVGGDYYDFFSECGRHVGLALADVSGHGLSAALLMAAVRTGIRLSAGTCPDLAELAARLNQLFYESTSANQFVAAVLGLIDTESRTLRFCNAGHLPPLRVGSDGDVEFLEGGGMILGAFPGQRYEEHAVDVRPGDLFVFYTDGLTEMVDPDDEEFGLERLIDVLRRNRDLPLDEVSQAVRAATQEHRRGARQGDDITLMLARWAREPV